MKKLVLPVFCEVPSAVFKVPSRYCLLFDLCFCPKQATFPLFLFCGLVGGGGGQWLVE